MHKSNIGIENAKNVLRSAIAEMPTSAGIYKMIDANQKVIYVGKAKNLPKRVSSYVKIENLTGRLQRMVAQIAQVEFITTTSEAEALLLESNIIKKLQPVYNILLKDDKSFPYIFFDAVHPYPRITKYRGNKRIKGSYFGPFASAHQVKMAIVELQKIFQIRPCTDTFFATRIRPCIQHEIKRCSAPCVSKISEDEYQKAIVMAKDFLSGKSSKVHEKLLNRMDELSLNMEYEKAAQLRDRIKILTAIQAKNTFSDMKNSDVDLIIIARKLDATCIQIYFIRGGKNYGNKTYFPGAAADINTCEIIEKFIGHFYQINPPPKNIVLNHNCESRELLETALSKNAQIKVKIIANTNKKVYKDLVEFGLNNTQLALDKFLRDRIKHEGDLNKVGKLFKINEQISRIEVYDNSHISGTNAIGCMIVYTAEGFIKNEYRKFNIKTTNEADDYTMLEEVLTRRLKRLSIDNKPSLMLIDGGKGHLSTAKKVLEKMGLNDLNIVCISKGIDRNAGREFFHLKDGFSFQLDKHDKTLNFLQTLRDEAHRYAIKSHRHRRSIELKRSSLDLIPSIGHGRKRSLLKYFGSVEGVMQATVTDLVKVNGINKMVAQRIFNYLQNVNTK